MSEPDLSTLDLVATHIQPIGGGDTCRAWRVTVSDGSTVFVKQTPQGAVGMTALEAAGLRWLGSRGARVPEVLAESDSLLALSWVDAQRPSTAAAATLGRDLARLHSQPVDWFGCPPPMPSSRPAPHTGWVGRVRVPFRASAPPAASTADAGLRSGTAEWAEFYVTDRLVPTADQAQHLGGLTESMRRRVDDLCDALLTRPDAVAGPPVEPAAIHGDLWAGNVMWQGDGATLIDPAAVGGHPETDLAMLHLFGLPHLDTVLNAYADTRPLPPGWQARIPLHQVFPLLVHAAMFGAGYGAQAADASVRALHAQM